MNEWARLHLWYKAGVARKAPPTKQPFECAERAGFTRTMNILRLLLRAGEVGVERNMPYASELFAAAATRGVAIGMKNIEIFLPVDASGVPRP